MNEFLFCQVCNIMFDARPHAKFCSARCRKRASRMGARGKGSDYEIIRKGAMLLSPNKQRSLAIILIENLDDAMRQKLYEQIKEDIRRVNAQV